MAAKKEFTYVVEKQFGTVSNAGSLPLEMNLISFAGAPAKMDLRRWRTKEDGSRSMQKGICLSREELLDLRNFLNAMEEI